MPETTVAATYVDAENQLLSAPNGVDYAYRVAQMALDAIDFIEALEPGEVDLLGFSIGSFVAQEIALVRPRRCASWCSLPRLRREPAECTAGPPTSSAPSASPRRPPRNT